MEKRESMWERYLRKGMSRRSFLKGCVALTTLMGLSTDKLSEVVEAAEAMPMMAQHTLVVVTDMDLFRLDEGQRGLLIELLGDFPEYCTLVFDQSRMTASFGTTTLSTVLLTGEYIDYRKILPASFRTTALADRVGVQNAIDRASLMAREGKNNLIRMSFSGDTLAISAATGCAGITAEEAAAIAAAAPTAGRIATGDLLQADGRGVQRIGQGPGQRHLAHIAARIVLGRPGPRTAHIDGQRRVQNHVIGAIPLIQRGGERRRAHRPCRGAGHRQWGQLGDRHGQPGGGGYGGHPGAAEQRWPHDCPRRPGAPGGGHQRERDADRRTLAGAGQRGAGRPDPR